MSTLVRSIGLAGLLAGCSGDLRMGSGGFSVGDTAGFDAMPECQSARVSALARVANGQVEAEFTVGDTTAFAIASARVSSGGTVVEEALSPDLAFWSITPEADDVPVRIELGIDCLEARPGSFAVVAFDYALTPAELGAEWATVLPEG